MMARVIKVRYKMVTQWLLMAASCCLLRTGHVSAAPCDKSPKDQYSPKEDGDNGFAILINGSPRLYLPEQIYTITLKGLMQENQVKKFTGFMLVASPAESNRRVSGNSENLGTIQLMPGDAMTKFSPKCAYAVEATSSINKEEIQVQWTSPPRGSGCIQFSAMVIERQDVWYMDDGALTYYLCEDNSPLAEPPKVEPCCACDEAKYEVIFEGIWSRHTHPKDFPRDEWRTQFSKLIGASHSINYTLWEYGRQASMALQALAEHGVTRRLETEMKLHSSEIRSVIKAHGLQQRSNVEGQTFAVFRVDQMHHLLSIVTKMTPSPDWIVGISQENLCLRDCSWVANRVIDLYPWDVGTQSGLSYDSPYSPTNPKGVIQRITSTNPNHVESPFFDATGAPMKPAARLHIIRQRLYGKSCSNHNAMAHLPAAMQSGLNPSWNSFSYGSAGDRSGPSGFEEAEQQQAYADDYESVGLAGIGYGGGFTESADPCKPSDWSSWTECSPSCGHGSRIRNRVLEDGEAGSRADCSHVQLYEKEPCRRQPKCPKSTTPASMNLFQVDEDDAGFPGYSSHWAQLGLKSDGLEASSNSYLYDGDHRPATGILRPASKKGPQKKTDHAYEPSSYMYSSDNSMYRPYSPIRSEAQSPRYARLQGDLSSMDEPDPDAPGHPDCETLEWGEWSDCSSQCDRGARTRTRVYKSREASMSCTEDLDHIEFCMGSGVNCPPRKVAKDEKSVAEAEAEVTNLGIGYSKPRFSSNHKNCQTSAWSEWSPCSRTCGESVKTRSRLFLIPFVEDRSCDLRLIETEVCEVPKCFNSLHASRSEHDDGLDNDQGQLSYRPDLENSVYYDEDGLDNEGQTGDGRAAPQSPVESFCFKIPDPGSCSGAFTRWYYDVESGSCYKFTFHGCGGNKNNFPSELTCLNKCKPKGYEATTEEAAAPLEPGPKWAGHDTAGSTDQRFKKFKSMSFKLMPEEVEDTEVTTMTSLLDVEGFSASLPSSAKVDCLLSHWSDWSSCSKSCGVGWSTRQREVLVEPANDGKECAAKMSRKRKCRIMPCPADTKYWYHGSWRHML